MKTGEFYPSCLRIPTAPFWKPLSHSLATPLQHLVLLHCKSQDFPRGWESPSPLLGNPLLSLLETPCGQMFAMVPPEPPAAGPLSYHGQVWQIHIVVQLVLLRPALGQVVDVGVGLRVFPLHQAVNRQQDIPSGGIGFAAWLCGAAFLHM